MKLWPLYPKTVRQYLSTLCVALSLVCGTGIGTALFIILSASFQPLPFYNSDELVRIDNDEAFNTINRDDFYHTLHSQHSMTDAAVLLRTDANMQVRGSVLRTHGTEVSASFFTLLGAMPLLGHAFTPGSDDIDGPAEIILSNDFWRTTFHGDAHVIGSTVTIGICTFKIIGVMSREGQFPTSSDYWIPTIFNNKARIRENSVLDVITVGRLRGGTPMSSLNKELVASYKLTNPKPTYTTDELPEVSFLRVSLRSEYRIELQWLCWAFLVFCSLAIPSIAQLFLMPDVLSDVGSAPDRRTLRIGRVLVVSVSEIAASAMLAAHICGRQYDKFLVQDFQVNPEHLTPIKLLIIATFIFLLLNSLIYMSCMLLERLHRLRLGVFNRDRLVDVYHKSFVILQCMSAFALLVAAFALYIGIHTLNDNRFRFNTTHLLTAATSPNIEGGDIHALAQTSNYYSAMLHKLISEPSIASAAVITPTPVPWGQDDQLVYMLEDSKPRITSARVYITTVGYFATAGIPIESGAIVFLPSQSGISAVVVSHAFALKIWGSTDVIGKVFKLPLDGYRTLKVAAIAANSYRPSHYEIRPPEIYMFCNENPCRSGTVIARTKDRYTLGLSKFAQLIESINSRVPVYRVTAFASIIRAGERILIFKLNCLSMLGVSFTLLAFVGLSTNTYLDSLTYRKDRGLNRSSDRKTSNNLVAIGRAFLYLALPGSLLGAIVIALFRRTYESACENLPHLSFWSMVHFMALFSILSAVGSYVGTLNRPNDPRAR